MKAILPLVECNIQQVPVSMVVHSYSSFFGIVGHLHTYKGSNFRFFFDRFPSVRGKDESNFTFSDLGEHDLAPFCCRDAGLRRRHSSCSEGPKLGEVGRLPGRNNRGHQKYVGDRKSSWCAPLCARQHDLRKRKGESRLSKACLDWKCNQPYCVSQGLSLSEAQLSVSLFPFTSIG